ncbi:MAG: hypothetical protein IPL46_05665 [Saprospiraceae bacterium]|nr:hypothetical protein [Saprospiraceae bacterium]
MNRITCTLMMAFVSLMLHAQSDYEIKEDTLSMSRGEKNSFTLVIPNATAGLAEDTWKKYMRDFKGRPKLNKKSNEWMTDNAELKVVSDNTIDIYTKFHENPELIRLMSCFGSI